MPRIRRRHIASGWDQRSREHPSSVAALTIPQETADRSVPRSETSKSGFRITRRALLGFGSGIAASPVVNALAVTDGAIYAIPTQDGIEISYLGSTWTCALAWFGGASHDLGSIAEIRPDGGDPVAITIKHVQFPGSDLRFDLKIKLLFIDGRGAIAFAIPAFRIEAVIDLIDWTDGVQPFSGRLSAKQARSIAAALENRSLAVEGKGSFSFSARGVFALEGAITARATGVIVPIRRLEFSADASSAPSGVRAPAVLFNESHRIEGYVAGPITTLWAYPDEGAAGTFAKTESAFAKLSDLSFVNDSAEDTAVPAFSMVLADLSTSSKTCIVAKSLTFNGGLAFEAMKAAAHQHVGTWPQFPLINATLRELMWGKRSHGWLHADFDTKATYVPTGHVPVTITGGEDRGLWAECNGPELVAFTARAEVNHAFVPMAGADYSRIDFEGTELHYGLEELAPDSHAASPVAAGYMLGEPPVFSAVMGERAIVRVLRAPDLFSLKYSFRDIYLVSKPGETTLDSCENCIPGFKLAPGRAPLMIVRFPPQHIAEKAFLKVERGAAVEPAVPLGQQRLYETNASPNNHAHLLQASEAIKNASDQAAAKVISTANLEAAKSERDKDLKSGLILDNAVPQGYVKLDSGDLIEVLDHIVEARMAGPTRLVFAFDPLAPNARRFQEPLLPRHYALGDLVNWKGLTAKVASRALRREATLLDQMRVAGIAETTPAIEKTYVIDRNLSAPDAEATAIEFPYRLQLSPANDAMWHTPRALTQDRIDRGVSLWSARLDPDSGGRSVRALWSPDFDQARHGFFRDRRHPLHSNEQPWRDPLSFWERHLTRLGWPVRRPSLRLPMNGRDRHELVILSSVYGLPALLPVPPARVDAAQDDDLKRAESTVFPPPKGFPQEEGVLGKEGVYAPQPLMHAQMALSSLGATVNLHGQWEPPSGFTLEGEQLPLWPALTIERWHHEAFLGRDTFVEVVYKGFIFPLGHRCSVIKATERKFIADPNDRSGKAPVAYLVQRYFVVIGEPTKPFPAVGQRFHGRALYSSAITMVTTVTPDIVDPFENALLKDPENPEADKRVFGQAGGAAFFPKSLPGHGLEGAVLFEYEIEYADGEKRKFKGPLIVVDNTLAHDPKGIEELVDFYNNTIKDRPDLGDRGRTADGQGQRIRYAEDNRAGSTEFVTREWLLGAHGREIERLEREDPEEDIDLRYTMDAVMEGADQPPFYPVCAEARIEVQSLNYMNGRSQGFTPAGYDLHYLQHGFSPKNPSGIFLSLLEGDGSRTSLTLDSNTRASGGIATPNMKAVALSREKGPVGGVKPTVDLAGTLRAPSARAAGALVPTTADARGSDVDFELSFAQQGQFDALEALMGALKLPKLFGIIPLQSLIPILSFIDGAPGAIESTIFKITENLDQFADEAALVIADLRTALATADATVNERLAAYSNSLGLQQPLQFADLYPPLHGSFKQLDKSLAALEQAAVNFNPTKPDTVFKPLGDTAAAIKATIAEVKAVARHPKPAIVDTFVKGLNDALHAVGAALGEALRNELKALRDELEDALVLRLRFEREVEIDPETELEQMASAISLVSASPEILVGQAPPFPVPATENVILYQFLVGALTGRPDTWAPVFTPTGVQGQPPHISGYYQELAFDLRTFKITTENVQQATEATADQLIEQVLLNDSLAKPLIDGYLVLANLVAGFEKDVGDFERQLRDLPRQLSEVLVAWLEGALGLQRLFALAKRFEAEAKRHLVDALKKYVDPLVAGLPEVKGASNQIDTQFVQILEKIDLLVAKPEFPPGASAALSEGRVRLAKLRIRLDAALDDYEALRIQLNASPPSERVANTNVNNLAKVQAQLSGALGKFYASQSAALTALADTIDATLDMLETIAASAIADVEWLATRSLLIEIETASLRLIELIVLSPTYEAAVKDFENIIQTFDAEIKAQLDDSARTVSEAATKILDDAREAITTNADEVIAKGRAFLEITSVALAEYGAIERRLTGLATRGLLIGKEALARTDAYLFGKLKPLLTRALALLSSDSPPGIYQAAKAARAVLKPGTWLTADQIAILKLFLDKKLFDILDNDALDTALAGEQKTIDALKSLVESKNSFAEIVELPDPDDPTLMIKPVNELEALLATWSTNPPAPARVLEPIQQLADLLLNGKLSDLIDLGPLEDTLRQALLRFIPARISFDYDWGVPLKPFPSESSKIFWIDRERKQPNPPAGTFPPSIFTDKVRKPNHDLTIYVRAGVDLTDPEDPKPLLQAEGDIRYCNVKLFGPSFDVVTVKFDQISFKADRSGSDFNVKLAPDPVAFGKMVRFIESLSKIFGDSGPYIYPAINPFGVVVGYRYQAPEEGIGIGTIVLLDFSIDISARLSFDNTPIAFRFALAERDKTLKILCTPYGGAGYVALHTVASDIIGFEMQLEFGGAVAISFGPLSAYGFVSAGIYIEKRKGQDLILEGFVRAVGQGNIACFSIAVFFEVRVRQVGSNVTGSLTVKVSFKVGFAKISFSYTAAYTFSGGAGGGGGRTTRMAGPARATDVQMIEALKADVETIDVDVPNRVEDWRGYRNLFHGQGA